MEIGALTAMQTLCYAESYTAVWMEVCAAPRGTLGRKQPSRWITRADVMDTHLYTASPKPYALNPSINNKEANE